MLYKCITYYKKGSSQNLACVGVTDLTIACEAFCSRGRGEAGGVSALVDSPYTALTVVDMSMDSFGSAV